MSAAAAEALGWITTAVLARDILGLNARVAGRAGRDWCQRRGVPYRRDGQVNWVRLDDVRAALHRLPGAAAPGANDDARPVPAPGAWGAARRTHGKQGTGHGPPAR